MKKRFLPSPFSQNIYLILFSFHLIIFSFELTAQPTNPKASTIPYFQNFSTTFITNESLSLAGMNFSIDNQSGFRSSELELLTVPETIFLNQAIRGSISGLNFQNHTLNGLGSISFLEAGNSKLMYSMGSNTLQNVLALSTTGISNLNYYYELKLTENHTTVSGSNVTKIAHCVLQYRVGSGGTFSGWNTVSGTDYSTKDKSVGEIKIMKGVLPIEVANKELIQLRWITFQNDSIKKHEYLSFTLDNILITNESVDASKLGIEKIFPINDTKIVPNADFGVLIRTLNANNLESSIPSQALVRLEIGVGSGVLSGNLATITGGSSSLTLTGLKYNLYEKGISIHAISTTGGYNLAASQNSSLFDVGRFATKLIGIKPVSILVGDPLGILIQLNDEENKPAVSFDPITITSELLKGTGKLSGNSTIIIPALVSEGYFNGIVYSNTDSINIKVTPSIFSEITITGINIVPNFLSGTSSIYLEDFEKVNKNIKGPNGFYPAMPQDMKIFNLDNVPTSKEYPNFGTDGFVVLRRPSRGVFPYKKDDEDQYNKSVAFAFENKGSLLPDSNYVAAATSFFNSSAIGINPKPANRWLITPSISLLGDNLKFSLQAMSGTNSGEFEDLFQVLYSEIAPGTTVDTTNWKVMIMTNEVLAKDSLVHSAPTVPIRYSGSIPKEFNNKNLYFAVRLVTGKVAPYGFGGDRLYVDNLMVTHGFPLSVDEDIEKKPIAAFPNPANEMINLSFHNKSSGLISIVLISSQGKETTIDLGILSEGQQLVSLLLSNVNEGFYICKIITPSGVQFTKFVKN